MSGRELSLAPESIPEPQWSTGRRKPERAFQAIQKEPIGVSLMYNAKAYSAASASSPLASTKITRRDPTEHDVQIEILFCGICHSDLHQVRNEWSSVMPTVYPCTPGHEILGRVTRVGSAVTRFKPGA